MTENEIIKAGFSRVDISAEESGDLPYSYYHLEFGEEYSLCLMASEKGGEFVVTFLDYDHFEILEYAELKKLIEILNRNLKQSENANCDQCGGETQLIDNVLMCSKCGYSRCK